MYCVIPVSGFVVRLTKVFVSFYVALSTEAEVMVAELTDHASANVNCTSGNLEFVNMPIFCLMARDVVTRFCWVDLKICLSSQVLIMGWSSAYCSV